MVKQGTVTHVTKAKDLQCSCQKMCHIIWKPSNLLPAWCPCCWHWLNDCSEEFRRPTKCFNTCITLPCVCMCVCVCVCAILHFSLKSRLHIKLHVECSPPTSLPALALFFLSSLWVRALHWCCQKTSFSQSLFYLAGGWSQEKRGMRRGDVSAGCLGGPNTAR